MITAEKLQILSDAAKFDVSCSSSGSNRKNKGGIGNACQAGICHSFTKDGRCVSLLKILMTNHCVYDCAYCLNRRSNDVPRAIATPTEICELTMEFYKRNYIEGLFLSSAVYKNPNYTMELLLETVKKLRKLYGFHGYIHLKGIPGADSKLVMQAGELVDRMSFNVELPSEQSLRLLAPQKTKKNIVSPIGLLRDEKAERLSFKSKFLPAGQTTQLIVGASPEKDGQILNLTQALYGKFALKRVYFSSFVPVVSSALLPTEPAGLLREHRLYQADWLIRFYGFKVSELISENENLSLEFDPKCAWAIKHPEFFPVDVNAACLEELIRIPGIGIKSAYKIISARRYGRLALEDLLKMKISIKRAIHFITFSGKFFGSTKELTVENSLKINTVSESAEQLSLFSTPQITTSVLTGEL